MFHYLLDVVCLNAFIKYKKKGGSISRLDFLLTLAESLSSMGGVVELPTRGRPSKSPKPSRLLGHCFPDMVPGTYQEMCHLLSQWKEERVIILVFQLWEGPMCSTVFSSLPHRQKFKNLKKKKTNFEIIVNTNCISSLHQVFITYWKKPLCLHHSSCFIATRNNKHLNIQGRWHQQPRKDPVKGLTPRRLVFE